MLNTESDDGNIVVETITLDSFVQDNNLHDIQFIKIDVEGFELRVLKGAQETIKLFKPTIMIEYLAMLKTGTDHNVRELQKFMDLAGYTAYRVHKRPRPHIKAVTSEDFKMPIHFNAICKPR